MEKKARTVPEQLGKIARGFAEITRKMEAEKTQGIKDVNIKRGEDENNL